MIKKITLTLLAIFIATLTFVVFAWDFWINHLTESTFLDIPVDTIIVDDRHEELVVLTLDFNDNKISHYKDGKIIETYTQGDLPTIPKIFTAGPNGKVWGLSVEHIYAFENSRWKMVAKTPVGISLPNDFVVDSEGRLWTDGVLASLYLYEDRTWQKFTPSNSPLPPGLINTIAAGQDGKIVIGTQGAIAITNGVDWEILPPLDDGVWVNDVAFDLENNIWVGTGYGLYFYSGREWILYSPLNSGLHGYDIRNIAVDNKNRIWASSDDGIVSVYDGVTWQYSMPDKIKPSIVQIVSSSDGKVYITGIDKGIQIINANANLLSQFDLTFKDLLHSGSITYIILLPIMVWVMILLEAWGIGFGVFFGGIFFMFIDALSLLIFGTPLGYKNPGFIITLGGFIGGAIGYFYNKRGKVYADIVGGAIGCGTSVMFGMCVLLFFALW